VSLRSSFHESGVGEIAYYVCYVLVVTILAQTLFSMITVAGQAISSMVGLMQGIFPILILLMTALGGTVSTGVFQPAMALLSNGVATFFKNIILPPVTIGGAVAIIGNVSDRIQLKRLFELATSVCQWLVGIVFTVYLGIVSIEGMTAAAIDGISIRTAKFTIDKIIPIAGKLFSDTVDTVLGCSLVVKNAVGMAGLMLCIAVIILPVIKCIASIFMFKIAAAVIEPIADSRMTNCLSDMSKVLILLLLAIMAVALMMFITISLALSASNANVMMR
jgi:stage III sporulation protein AE